MDQCDQHGLFFFHDVMPHAVAHDTVTFADTAPTFDAYAFEVGDDNADGIITEDESGWDCRTMGNRICGPGAVLPDGSLAIPGDYTAVHPDGSPAWPTGEPGAPPRSTTSITPTPSWRNPLDGPRRTCAAEKETP